MNPGGVRADLLYNSSPSGEAPGVVTYGESFAVQPFGNNLVTLTYTGAQLYQVLEEQYCGGPANRTLLPSRTVNYTVDLVQAAANQPKGSEAPKSCATTPKVVSNLTINGVPVEPTQSYRITVNSFLADGGDSFPTLAQGTDRFGGPVDTDALEAYFQAHPNVEPPALDRIDPKL